MSTYAQLSHVSARLGGRASLDNKSEPTAKSVQDMLDQAEAELLGKMASVGIPTSYATGTGGAKILAGWVARYVSGLVRVSHAAAGGDGGNSDGQNDVSWWDGLFARLSKDPSGISGMLNSGSVSSNSVGIGGHTTDTTLNLTDSDVAPEFTRGGFNF